MISTSTPRRRSSSRTASSTCPAASRRRRPRTYASAPTRCGASGATASSTGPPRRCTRSAARATIRRSCCRSTKSRHAQSRARRLVRASSCSATASGRTAAGRSKTCTSTTSNVRPRAQSVLHGAPIVPVLTSLCPVRRGGAGGRSGDATRARSTPRTHCPLLPRARLRRAQANEVHRRAQLPLSVVVRPA